MGKVQQKRDTIRAQKQAVTERACRIEERKSQAKAPGRRGAAVKNIDDKKSRELMYVQYSILVLVLGLLQPSIFAPLVFINLVFFANTSLYFLIKYVEIDTLLPGKMESCEFKILNYVQKN